MRSSFIFFVYFLDRMFISLGELLYLLLTVLGGLFIWWLYWTTRDILNEQKNIVERLAVLEANSKNEVLDSLFMMAAMPHFKGAEPKEEDTTTFEVNLDEEHISGIS